MEPIELNEARFPGMIIMRSPKSITAFFVGILVIAFAGPTLAAKHHMMKKHHVAAVRSAPATGAGENTPTATGGQPGGSASKN